jgi:hypothetical protein
MRYPLRHSAKSTNLATFTTHKATLRNDSTPHEYECTKHLIRTFIDLFEFKKFRLTFKIFKIIKLYKVGMTFR